MLKKIKAAYRKFSDDKPGKRFLHLHREWERQARGAVLRIAGIATGVLLIVGGLLLGLVPGVPGILLGVAGVALIAAQFRWMAQWCDKAEVWARGFFNKPHRHKTAHPH